MRITRAEEIAVGPARLTIRSPVAVWILSFVTLGIWAVVWTYQVTRELRDYSQAVTRPFSASPVVAAVLAASWPLAFIPGIVGAFANGRRVRTVQDWVDARHPAHGIVAALLFPLLFAHTMYLQAKLNDAWRRAREGHGPPPDYARATGTEQRVAEQARQESLRRGYDWR